MKEDILGNINFRKQKIYAVNRLYTYKVSLFELTLNEEI